MCQWRAQTEQSLVSEPFQWLAASKHATEILGMPKLGGLEWGNEDVTARLWATWVIQTLLFEMRESSKISSFNQWISEAASKMAEKIQASERSLAARGLAQSGARKGGSRYHLRQY